MTPKKFSLIALIIISTSCFSQSLTPKESSDLSYIIHLYFYQGPHKNKLKSYERPDGPSEALLCLLTTDSTGKINSIRFLSDDTNRDSAYSIFSNLKLSDFANWQAEKCKDKTLMIPLVLFGPTDNPAYPKDLLGRKAFMPGEKDNLIILAGLGFFWPRSIHKKVTENWSQL